MLGKRLAPFALLGVAATAAFPASPVLAECARQTNAFPSFADVAPTAEQVVIGTVVRQTSGEPLTVAFELRVDEVLRGDAPPIIEVSGLRSGLPLQGTSACRGDAQLFARVGNVLAIAIDGRYEGRHHVNTVAWIDGRPNDLVLAESLTRGQVRRAAATLPSTSTSSAPEVSSEARRIVTDAMAWFGGILRILRLAGPYAGS